jgi:anti-sigma regulatory factor (Ser/Thr protein kinase)
MEGRKIKHFEIENRIEEISSLAFKIEELAKDWNLSPGLTMNINLVVEEALSNIIFYAFKSEEKHKIKIAISLQKKEIIMEFIDSGIAFNPLKQQSPDISLPAEERPIGGLGIFLISQIMDKMNYKRKSNQNVLTLKKSIKDEN